MKKFIVMLMALLLVVGNIGCSKEETTEPITRTELIMGTVVKITLYENGSEKILDKVFERVKEIEDLVSINEDGTELDKLNENAGIMPVRLSDTSLEIIDRALYYSEMSDGGYDLTIGPLVKLWSIGLPEAKVPTKEEINEVIKNIDYSKVKINKDTNEVFLSEKGMLLDLGSIAKGYAADEIVKILNEENINSAIIDLGGNIYALGLKDGNKNWKIGIQNPFDNRGRIIGALEVSNKTVVTSGVYERYIEQDGVKYHHILNPSTGYPYDTEIAGVSIISDKSIDGDALSTLIFTKGLEEGLEFVENIENIDAIFVTNNKDVYITKGLKGNFEITNEEFTLKN